MTARTLKASRIALAATAGLACLFINEDSSSTRQSSLITQADARVGRPATPASGAGVARRTERRATRRGAAVGAAVGAGAAAVGAGAAAIGAGAADEADEPYYEDAAPYAAAPYAAAPYPAAPYAAAPYPAAPYYAYGAAPYYGAGAYYDYGAAAPPPVYGAPAYYGPGYGPGPEPGSYIVNPATGRWCRTQPDGYQWCWTP